MYTNLWNRDGTSIILSDDVGQLYILSTGQGESQKDAKYDQVQTSLNIMFVSFICYCFGTNVVCKFDSSFLVIIDLSSKTLMVMYLTRLVDRLLASLSSLFLHL